MRTALINLTIAASIATLAACGGPVLMTASQDISFPVGAHSTFVYAALPGEMLTVIVGNPFPEPKPEVDGAITTAMFGKNNGPPVRFTTTPGPQARTHFRIVIMFDPPIEMNNRRLCGEVQSLPAPMAGSARLTMLTAFCSQEDILSWVQASMPRPGSTRDPTFVGMVANTIWRLIPDRDMRSDLLAR